MRTKAIGTSPRLGRSRRHDLSAGLAALLVLSAGFQPAWAEDPVPIRSTFAVTGDSLVINGERYRLWGIDAPDLDQPCMNADGQSYACGREARVHLLNILSMGPYACRVEERPPQAPPLLSCELGGFDVGEMMVRSGYAFDDVAVSGGAYAPQEHDARMERLGLWSGPFVKPEDWRRGRLGMR